MHIRSVTAFHDDRWLIEDRIQPLANHVGQASHSVSLHWLLQDWEWKLDDSNLTIAVLSPRGWIRLAVSCQPTTESPQPAALSVQLVRAGQLLHGNGEISPTWGWASPTYGIKKPALSFAVTVSGNLPITLTSEWRFADG